MKLQLFKVYDAVRWEILKLSPTFRSRLREHLNFDSDHNVVTSPKVSLEELDITDKSKSYWYEACEPWLIKEILDSQPFETSRTFTLIDLGCGMGRVLLIASKRPFLKIVGVEVSQSLSEVARKNLLIYLPKIKDLSRFSVINQDAALFTFPPTDLFITLFNPFPLVIMERVIGNLVKFKESFPEKQIKIAYVNPLHHEAITKRGAFSLEIKTKRYELYSG